MDKLMVQSVSGSKLKLIIKYFLLIPLVSFAFSVLAELIYFGWKFNLDGQGPLLIIAGSLFLNSLYGLSLLPIFLNLIIQVRQYRVFQLLTFLVLPLIGLFYSVKRMSYKEPSSDFIFYAGTGIIFLLTANVASWKFNKTIKKEILPTSATPASGLTTRNT
jgi:hypothetical protein